MIKRSLSNLVHADSTYSMPRLRVPESLWELIDGNILWFSNATNENDHRNAEICCFSFLNSLPVIRIHFRCRFQSTFYEEAFI